MTNEVHEIPKTKKKKKLKTTTLESSYAGCDYTLALFSEYVQRQLSMLKNI